MDKPYAMNRTWWNEVTPVHVKSDLYEVDEFLRGGKPLDPVVLNMLGDISGLKVLHLQCHFGLDSLSLARLGAEVTAVDFSEAALTEARRLALTADLESRCRFVQADVLDLLDAPLGEFDIVFTTYGVINWLNDLTRWGRVIARHLKPGGRLVFAEIHPTAMMLEGEAGKIAPGFDYFHDPAGIVLQGHPDYADRSYVPQAATREWAWSLEDIFGALSGAGLRMTRFREYPFCVCALFPGMKPGPDGFWYLPEGSPRIPMLFALSAVRE